MSEGEAKRGEEAGLMFKLGWEGGGGKPLSISCTHYCYIRLYLIFFLYHG